MNPRKQAAPVITKKLYLVAYSDGTPADIIPGVSGELVRRFVVSGGKVPESVRVATDEELELYATFNQTTVAELKALTK